jgi:hypothetical protein
LLEVCFQFKRQGVRKVLSEKSKALMKLNGQTVFISIPSIAFRISLAIKCTLLQEANNRNLYY